jgi:riboflavin synthase
MFSGIVEMAGQVVSFQRGPDAWKLVVSADAISRETAVGSSIAVNGCCLTAVQAAAGCLHFDVVEETRRLTNL